MLGVIRDYAWEHLAESGEQATMEGQHARYFVALSKQWRLFEEKCAQSLPSQATKTRSRKCSSLPNPNAWRMSSLILLFSPSTRLLLVRRTK